ncbi:MAG: ribosome-associated protein [Fimbriimonadaceae bacterium]|jgi:ribosome-associated protein|nr:ribosome-associated protein [Fimbriimonadaceae bacterium]
MTSQEKLQAIIDAADELKAESIETLDVREKTSVADYFVVCSGTSDRHVSSIAEKVAERLLEKREKPLRVEGDRTGWVLQDYGDVILHVMRDEQRQFYDLETLWKTMQPSPDLNV